MTQHDDLQRAASTVLTRQQFIDAAAIVGAGIALGNVAPLSAAMAAQPRPSAACGESVQDVLNLAYTIERAATTFYYTGLTSKAILRNQKIAGASGNPNAVSPNGNAENVANLQAALDQEQKHAQILANAGAVSSHTRFYFPASAFESLGYTSHAGTFLWVLDHLETACVAIYLAAVRRFGQLGRPDLALLSVRNLAVECEHRALYRVISEDDPADNMTLPVTAFSCVSNALSLFAPYLSGRGFPRGVTATHAIPLPTPAQTARVIGRYTST